MRWLWPSTVLTLVVIDVALLWTLGVLRRSPPPPTSRPS